MISPFVHSLTGKTYLIFDSICKGNQSFTQRWEAISGKITIYVNGIFFSFKIILPNGFSSSKGWRFHPRLNLLVPEVHLLWVFQYYPLEGSNVSSIVLKNQRVEWSIKSNNWLMWCSTWSFYPIIISFLRFWGLENSILWLRAYSFSASCWKYEYLTMDSKAFQPTTQKM